MNTLEASAGINWDLLTLRRLLALMHEIVTLQIGSQANYLGTHFWNAQVCKVLCHDPLKSGLVTIRNPILHTLDKKSLQLIMM